MIIKSMNIIKVLTEQESNYYFFIKTLLIFGEMRIVQQFYADFPLVL